MAHHSDPPTKKDVALAAWQAMVTTKLDNIEDRVSRPDPEVAHNTKRLDGIRNVTIAVVLAFLGLVATFLTTCSQHTERDAEMRATVEQHKTEIKALREAVTDINKARSRDTDRLIKSIERLRDTHVVSESGVDCSNLTSSERHRLRAIMRDPQLCVE